MSSSSPAWESDCGTVRLWRGDCLEILPTWPAGAVDAVVTDPPYGIGGYVANPSKWRRARGLAGERWDDCIVDLSLSLSVCDKCVIWGGNNYTLPASRNFLVWHKPDSPPSMADAEFAWCSWDGNSRHVSATIGETNRERTGHPTQKPIKVMVASLEHAGGQTIADPFMGSGTTGVAAVRLGRKFWGIELDEQYFEIAKRRIQDELRKVAFLEPAPKTLQASLLDD